MLNREGIRGGEEIHMGSKCNCPQCGCLTEGKKANSSNVLSNSLTGGVLGGLTGALISGLGSHIANNSRDSEGNCIKFVCPRCGHKWEWNTH